MFRFCFQLILLAVAILGGSVSQTHAQNTNRASLSLFITAGGTVSPLTNGQFLEVGQTYNMVASPDSGFVFSSWEPVNVFTFTTYTIDPSKNTNAVVSVVESPLPIFTNQPSLNFVMQPVVVIENNPGVMSITKNAGWQANFGAILLNIQSGDSATILTWTNSNFTLQAASAPFGVYTNISGAVSPYTNNTSGSAKYFRLAK